MLNFRIQLLQFFVIIPGFLPLLLTPTKNPEIVFTKNNDIKSGPNVEVLDPPASPIYVMKQTANKKLTVLHDNLGFTYSNCYTTSGDGLGPQRVVWRCSQKYKQCKASCVVENGKIIQRKNFHNHAAQ